jgi:hypothetical protein
MKKRFLLTLGLLFFLSTPSKGFDLKIPNLEKSLKSSSQSKKKHKSSSGELVKKLDLAMVRGMDLYATGDFKESVRVFNIVDTSYNRKREKETEPAKFVENAVKVIANDRVVPYSPWIYERIMVNTMKAIDYILMGDLNHSRIEINRALVRELEAESEFRKEIERIKEEIQKRENQGESRKIKSDKSGKSSSLFRKENLEKSVSFIEKYYTNLKNFKAYNGFVNPFTNYLAGIYFLTQGDYEKAVNLLKECYGMIKGEEPADKIVADDFNIAFRLKSSVKKGISDHYVWIVFFNGKIGQRVEKKIDVPLFIFTRKVMYTGLALPDVKDGFLAFPYILYKVGKTEGKTLRLVDLDRLEKTEFKKRFPSIALRAVSRAILFTLAQGALSQKKSETFGAAGIIGMYQFLMNHADTRQWENLPKEIQIAKLRIKKKQKIKIMTPKGKLIKEIVASPGRNMIIFVNAFERDKVTVYKAQI